MGNATIVEVYGEGKIKELGELIPEGQSAKMYLYLISEQVLGRDREGGLRPYGDLALLLYQAKKTGLDPLSNQIYGVYRWDSRSGKEKMTIQVGIDGLRAIAQRTGLYAGSDDAIFEEENGKPKIATVTVKKINPKTGDVIETKASARWEEYKQTNKKGELMGMWAKMPYLMLGKCAEALALRKAFPNETSGIYIPEEMPTVEAVSDPVSVLPEPEKKEKVKELKIDKKVKEVIKERSKKDEN